MASEAVLARLTRIGQGFLTVPLGLAALQAVLHSMSTCSPSPSVVAVNPFNWQTYTAAMGLDPIPAFFCATANTLKPAASDVSHQLGTHNSTDKPKSATAAAAKVLSEAAIAGQVQTALQGILGDSISPDDPLMSAGLDSLGSVELANVLARSFSLQLPGTLIFDYPTVSAIAAYLHSRLKPLAPATQDARATEPVLSAEPISALHRPLQQGMGDTAPHAVAILSAVHQPMTASSHVGSTCSITWGADYIMPVPSARWDTDAASGQQQHSTHSMEARFGAFMEAVDAFDAAAFGLSAAEASSMDPQQRCLLQCSAEALSSAKQRGLQRDFGRSGVFVGVSWTEYAKMGGLHGMPVGAYTAQSAVLSVTAGKLHLSYACRCHLTLFTSALIAYRAVLQLMYHILLKWWFGCETHLLPLIALFS